MIWQGFGTLSPVTIGTELRDARERRGLSREQIFSTTKIQVAKIAALEEGAFDQLPTGIYLDGIAAACAREVGLDVDAFVRRLRAQVQPPPSESLEQIARVREQHERGAREAPLSVGRAMLAFASVAFMLVLASLGMRLFPLPSAARPQQALKVAKSGSIATPVLQEIPDSGPRGVATSGFERAEPAVVEPERPMAVDADTHVEEKAPTITAFKGAVVPPVVAGPAVEPPAAPQSPVQAPIDTRAASDVEGAWSLETRVASTSLSVFQGLRLGYLLELRQRGSRVEGTGRKISENGVTLGGSRRTPITVQGTIDNGRLKLTFGEEGARRRSTGTFDLVLEDLEVLRGSFSSDAARSAGVVQARRL